MSAGAIFIMSSYALAHPDAGLSAWAEAVESIPAVLQFGGILGLLHLFPTGRPIGRAHRWMLVALWTYIACFAVLGVINPDPLPLTGRANPLGVGPVWVGDVHRRGIGGLVVFALSVSSPSHGAGGLRAQSSAPSSSGSSARRHGRSPRSPSRRRPGAGRWRSSSAASS
jgi:hypothetical protein